MQMKKNPCLQEVRYPSNSGELQKDLKIFALKQALEKAIGPSWSTACFCKICFIVTRPLPLFMYYVWLLLC